MWIFQSVVDGNRKFFILPGKDCVIGRTGCDIAIENDQSVSRKHAILTVTHPESNVVNVNKPASLVLKDVSRFGTYVNNQKVKGDKTLQDGDEIRFGTPKSVHRVVYEPFVVTTSCVDGAGKKEVRSLVRQIGGHVSNEWRRDCKFLIMKTVTVTIKVVSALVSQKPIVTVDYLRDLLNFYKGENTETPAPEKYLPPVTERLIEPGVSFHVNGKRSSIFLGMSFYFLSEKQFQKMNLAVDLGGGVPILCDSLEGADLSAFLEDKTVVMNPAAGEVVNQEQKKWVEKVRSFLSKKGKFMVQDAEIGYAALYASTDDYCNADKDVSHLLTGALHSQSLTQAGSLGSQLTSTQAEDNQGKPEFKKPSAVPASVKEAPAFSGGTDSAEKAATVRSLELKDTHDDKEYKDFTVSESLTKKFVIVKKEKHTDSERSQSSTYVVHASCTEMSPSVSQSLKSKKPVAVKVEEDRSAQDRPLTSAHFSEKLDSCLPSAATVKQEPWTEDRKPVLLLDDEEDDIVQTRKQPPSKNKRRYHESSDDGDDDPFDFIKKRPRKAGSPAPKSFQRTTSPKHKEQQKADLPMSELQQSATFQDPKTEEREEEDFDPFDFAISRGKKLPSHDSSSHHKKRAARSPSPIPPTKQRRSQRRSPSPETPRRSLSSKRPRRSPSPEAPRRSPSPRRLRRSPSPKASRSPSPKPPRRSPSPKPKSKLGSPSRKGDDEECVLQKSTDSNSAVKPLAPKPARQPVGQTGDAQLESVTSHPVPEGFLTTLKPIRDQVAINPKFEKEDIDAPAVVVQFEDLVIRQNRPQTSREDQCDVPHGMMKWKGKIVPNFKKFTKVKHAGADRLPKIIGGRDLEEHCRSSNKMMEDWLKDLQDAESQQQEREREVQNLFDWQPKTLKAKKGRR